ncbi:MAG TPA: MarR family winged helix-turn-helix transcriptional regulator [Caulobacteraceae bacterium]|nr:MarR family winged helix-turn-helix transcriptional regulator [Caulobacteraceae bacterium]
MSNPGTASGPSRRRNSALDTMERLRALGDGMTFNAMLVFMYICENEGINVSELAQVCRMTEATASRSARALAAPSAAGALPPSLGLVELRQDPFDGRGRLLFLTASGRKLRDAIDDSIRAGITISR